MWGVLVDVGASVDVCGATCPRANVSRQLTLLPTTHRGFCRPRVVLCLLSSSRFLRMWRMHRGRSRSTARPRYSLPMHGRVGRESAQTCLLGHCRMGDLEAGPLEAHTPCHAGPSFRRQGGVEFHLVIETIGVSADGLGQCGVVGWPVRHAHGIGSASEDNRSSNGGVACRFPIDHILCCNLQPRWTTPSIPVFPSPGPGGDCGACYFVAMQGSIGWGQQQFARRAVSQIVANKWTGPASCRSCGAQQETWHHWFRVCPATPPTVGLSAGVPRRESGTA